MATDSKRSEKHELARNSLPPELRSTFDEFVQDYKFAGTAHHGSPFISYVILAEMVKAGWRPSGEPIDNWKKSRAGDTESIETSGKAEIE